MANGGLDIGKALLSAISGGLRGYVRGRQYSAQQKIAAEERRKEEERQQRKEEAAVEQFNRQREGQLIYGNLLNTVAGISPTTPYSEVQKLKSTALQAAGEAGYDMKTASLLFDQLSAVEPPEQVEQPSPFDLAKLESELALTEQRKASASASRARAKSYRQRAKDLKNDELVSSINALRLQRAQLVDKYGTVIPGREAEYEEIQAQLDAYNEENARRKGVKITPKKKKEENNDPLGIR